jgi:hypothetical protein
VLGLLAGALGWVVTDVSCREPGVGGVVTSCPGWAVIFALVAFVGATTGVAVLLVLVYRSIGEWRERAER